LHTGACKQVGGQGQRGRERKRERIPSRLCVGLSTEPDAGLDLTTLRSRPEQKPRVGRLTDSHPGAPNKYFLNWIFISADL